VCVFVCVRQACIHEREREASEHKQKLKVSTNKSGKVSTNHYREYFSEFVPVGGRGVARD
jgi:hypothetical protein